MAFQAGCLISVVPGGSDFEMEVHLCNVRRDLRSLLQTLRRQPPLEFLRRPHEDVSVVSHD